MSSSIRTNSFRPTKSVTGSSPPRTMHLGSGMLIVVAVLCLLTLNADVHAAPSINRNPGWPGETLSGARCHGGEYSYGPFDYVTEKSKLGIVEKFHFTPEVEQLIRGKSGYVHQDLSYTLGTFPNHHRALWAMSRYYLRKARQIGYDKIARLERAQDDIAPPECYFQRAKRFAPQDGMVPAIFGIYLHKRGKLDGALAEYRIAESKNPENSELIYNMGLLFLDMNDLPLAKQYAERATSLGYPLTGLQKRIKDREAQPFRKDTK